MKQIKFERLNLNRNKIIIGFIAVVVLVIGIILIKNAYSIGTGSTLSNQVVDGLSFENANVEVEDGITTFNADVINDSGDTYELKTITITLTNGSSKVTLVGYIGETLDKEEHKTLKASIDQELSNVTSVSYTINK
jgi:uncharacterized protein YxeA